MRTVASEYASYREQVIPPDAGAVQAQECKRAFYAGAAAMWDMLLGDDSEGGSPRDIQAELLRHSEDVRQGRA